MEQSYENYDDAQQTCGNNTLENLYRICPVNHDTVIDWKTYEPEFELLHKRAAIAPDQWIATIRDILPFEDKIFDSVPKIQPLILEKHSRTKFERIAYNGGAIEICR